MDLFTAQDFRVFGIAGFEDRMRALRSRVRPKLAAIGEDLAPAVASIVDRPIHPHVAKHARRTVNPPDDTWVALGGDKRGYKKDVHFRVAVSRNCVRFLFEVGPDYYDKTEWALQWRRDMGLVGEVLGGGRRLGWFRDEHDEEPAALLAGLSGPALLDLGKELTRRRDGQLVLGRRVDLKDALGMSSASFRRAALTTFKSLGPLFALNAPRARPAVR